MQTLVERTTEESQTHPRPRRMLSSVASSSATAGYSSGSDDDTELTKYGPVRESRSLDPFPVDTELVQLPRKQPALSQVRYKVLLLCF